MKLSRKLPPAAYFAIAGAKAIVAATAIVGTLAVCALGWGFEARVSRRLRADLAARG